MLYIVATPLGNLEDITARALKALQSASCILAEDTRRTRGLLSHFNIHVPVERYSDHDERGVSRAMEELVSGKTLALVSDGGTPVISDPGLKLVARCRETGIPVISLPGPCAVTAAVAGSGLPGDSFVFLGFLPRSTSKRRRLLLEAAALDKTVALYEAPQRLLELLEDIRQSVGPATPTRVVRELSKLHEEWLGGTPEEIISILKKRERVLGEIVLIFSTARKPHGKDH